MKKAPPAIDIITYPACTGCCSCGDSCAYNAISFKQDENGFYRPFVSKPQCTDCGVCSRRCPVLITPKAAPETPSVYGGWSNDASVRQSTTSGGAAFELASWVIEQGGVVVGCVMNSENMAEHRLIRTKEDLVAMRGSKYIQSNVTGVYKQAIKAARDGEMVLFTGMPCQVAAFQTYLSPATRERVLTADIVCYGVPSMLAWQKHLEESFRETPTQVFFRDKSVGWTDWRVRYNFAGGKVEKKHPGDDKFLAGFHACAFHQLSCHSCPVAGVPRQGDITFGGFWGVPAQYKDEKGVSLILASSERGKQAVKALEESGRLTLFESTLEVASASNPRLVGNLPNSKPNPHREEVLEKLRNGASLNEVSKLYMKSTFERKLRRTVLQPGKRFVKRFLVSLGVLRAGATPSDGHH